MSQYADLERELLPDDTVLPLMSLREVVMFPKSIVPLFVGRDASIKAIESAIALNSKHIFLVTQKLPEKERPEADDLFAVGTVSRILQMLRLPDGTIKVLFEGLYRANWSMVEPLAGTTREFPLVRVDVLEDVPGSVQEGEALVRAVNEGMETYARGNKKIAPESLLAMAALRDPGALADAVMPHLKVDFERKQRALEITDCTLRLEYVYEMLLAEIEIVSIEKRVKGRVKGQMEKNQREYYLNEQVKAIHKEMGREDDPAAEAAELEKRLDEKVMPEETRERARKEIRKLRQMQPSSAEYTVLRNYVDWVLDLPWGVVKEMDLDIAKARAILDEDHYGLEKPKERILEYIAVQSLVKSMKGPILCFVGPPGVGKTSIAKSIARAMDREFMRLSLGGVRDEAEIRGHRRTYVGALPGKIIHSLRRCKFNNPVICLDEVDKMSTDFRGDPSSALLEVLDPEQNYAFNDHYLDLDYDLSKVFFITTANTLDSIPLPLRDRMEIIRLPGYLETEKLKIAKQFLLGKQRELHGLTGENLSISDNAVLEIIRRYTREAGVRNLERELASLCRKAAMKIVETRGAEDSVHSVTVNKQGVATLLGIPKHRHEEREDKAQVGVSTGLAWTQMGGEILFVEVVIMNGSGKVEITGKLGDVMQESTRAALSYLRSRSDIFGLKRDFHKEIDIHVHVPEGATPKDGPSAGVALVTAIVSALLNIPVRPDVAMTGEITLRGRVLPIGGLREKLLAAHRGLVGMVLIPAENEKDLKDVPAEILKDLKVVCVENVDEVLEKALVHDSTSALFCGRDNVSPVSDLLVKEEYQRPTH
ncbi:MAG: endopeptidase La [Proteobacteria bacterium]|nr:endopeptidase La [Pseudomonadota bacterium]MBU1594724.1 endopeptidase La [Pseudomonadota bacterium]